MKLRQLLENEYAGLEDADEFGEEESGITFYIVEVHTEDSGMWEENEHHNERTSGFYEYGRDDPADTIRELELEVIKLKDELHRAHSRINYPNANP